MLDDVAKKETNANEFPGYNIGDAPLNTFQTETEFVDDRKAEPYFVRLGIF